MQGYAWLYLIAYPIDYIIYAYNYIYGFSLFADEPVVSYHVKAIQTRVWRVSATAAVFTVACVM